MRLYPGVLILYSLLFAVAIGGCSNSSGSTGAQPANQVVPIGSQTPVAYLIYPYDPSGYVPYFNVGRLVFAARGINYTYKVSITGDSNLVWSITDVNAPPSSLPSPLASMPPGVVGPWQYVVASGTRSYFGFGSETIAVTLTGCPSPASDGSCASTQTIAAGSFSTDCGVPLGRATPPPSLAMWYPMPGATNVSASIGQLIVTQVYSVGTVSISAPGSSPIPLASPVQLPSPIPSGVPTPPYYATLYQLAIPPLASGTTYTISSTAIDVNRTPPTCMGPYYNLIGTFTTQ